MQSLTLIAPVPPNPTKEGRTIALIPARGGSKGIPRKNLVDLGGRPLIAWTISAALDCPLIERVVVSTDDADIANVALAARAELPGLRPPELAGDHTPMLDVVRYVLEVLSLVDEDLLVLLQPTSPFRTVEDISEAIQFFRVSGARSLISVTRSVDHPAWLLKLDQRKRLSAFDPAIEAAARRQDLLPLFRPNGAIYIIRAGSIRASESWYGDNAVAYEMPRVRSLDIDDHCDLLVARAMIGIDTKGHLEQ